MKTIKPWILAIFFFMVSFLAYGQEEKDESVIIKQGKRYLYNGSSYPREKLRTIIYSSHDAASIHLLDQARRYNTAGNVFLVTGSVVTVFGLCLHMVDKAFEDWWFIPDPEYKASNAWLVMASAGAGMVVLGGILKGSGNTALGKSIERFNSVHIGKQEVRFDLVPFKDTIGFGMTWKINNRKTH